MRLILTILLLALTASAENLLPNSGFELKDARGYKWNWGSGYDSAENYPEGYIVTNNASEGRYSSLCKKLSFRPVVLTAGVYSVSFDCYASSSPVMVTLGLAPTTSGRQFTGLASPANTWARHSGLFTNATDGAYILSFAHEQPLANITIDNVQLEAVSATAYAPIQIEAGIAFDSTNHTFFLGTNAQFHVAYWNDGPETNVVTEYNVYDVFNSNVLSGYVTNTLAAGTNTESADIDLTGHFGWHRILTRVLTVQDSWDEATYTYYNCDNKLTGGWLGAHMNAGAFDTAWYTNRNVYTFRSLSPSKLGRWRLVETSSNVFDFFQNDYWDAMIAAGLDIVYVMSPQQITVNDLGVVTDQGWPPWATNYTREQLFSAYTNHVWHVGTNLNAYGASNFKIELWNEPVQSGASNIINIREATNYVWMVTNAMTVLSNISPDFQFIIVGGASVASWGTTVWDLIKEGWGTNMIVGGSYHIYPKSQEDFNTPDPSETVRTFALHAASFNGELPVWNSEAGSGCIGSYKGWWGMGDRMYDLYGLNGPYTVEAERYWRQFRTPHDVMWATKNLWESMNAGFSHYICYYGRMWQPSYGFGDDAQMLSDWSLVETPSFAALVTAQSMVPNPVCLGFVTNGTTTLEAGLYTNEIGQIVAPFFLDSKGLATFTTTNGAFEVLDYYGNQIQTNAVAFSAGRHIQYIRTGDMDLIQLSNNLASASYATNNDTVAPNIVVDVAPVGIWESNRVGLVKWSTADNYRGVYLSGDSTNAILNSLSIDGTPVLTDSPISHYWLSGLSDGNHKLTITATDESENVGTVDYWFTGQSDPEPQAQQRTLRAGTLHIGR